MDSVQHRTKLSSLCYRYTILMTSMPSTGDTEAGCCPAIAFLSGSQWGTFCPIWVRDRYDSKKHQRERDLKEENIGLWLQSYGFCLQAYDLITKFGMLRRSGIERWTKTKQYQGSCRVTNGASLLEIGLNCLGHTVMSPIREI